MSELVKLAQRVKEASRVLGILSAEEKNRALYAIASVLRDSTPEILKQNDADVQNARQNGVPEPMIDRLRLTKDRVESMASAVEHVARLEDPIGQVEQGIRRPNGLEILKTRVPLGVVGMIYESRPNVTVDAAVLCLKSGNACLLRGGKEAIRSNTALAAVMRGALRACKLPADCIALLEDTSRETATEMMKLNGYIDVLIPRGGAGLIQSVVQNATVPVIETGVGNCHVYVDYNADIEMAVNIINNAKTSRPSVCNAAETLLVHKDIAAAFLPAAKARLDLSHVQLRGCERTREILGHGVIPATEKDYATEFLDYILAVKVVDSVYEAIQHIQTYTSMHSECIVTNDYANSQTFIKQVDAAAVYVNASTRFTDGGEFGLGAEIGISTQKLHARGPMGLMQLTTNKYIVTGNGQIR